MKKIGTVLAFALLGSFTFAQNGNGNGNNGNGNSTLNIAYVKVEDGFGDKEVIALKITRPVVNEISGITMGVQSSKVAALPMTKVSTEITGGNGNSGNNANETWVAEIDIDQFADSNGEVTLQFLPSCCYIPQGGIVVRSKGR